MKRKLKISLLPVFLLLMIVGNTGCNIFGFVTDAEKSDTEKAEDAIREGNYTKAKKELADAVSDSTDSMALYLNAKATLLESGVDLATLAGLIEGQEDIGSGDNLAILETIDIMDDTEKTAWYRANMEIRSNLSRIWKEQTIGVLKKDDVALGFTVSNMMSGVLGLRDTNRDGYIDASDFQIDLSFISNIGPSQAEGFNFDGAKIKDESGVVIEDAKFDGLTVFLGDWSGKIAGAQKPVARTNYTPDDINPLIAYVLSLLDEGAESILFLFSDEDMTAFDVDQIKKQIDDIALIINYYWYDDGIDNDGDGRIDEETIDGLDNDNDGLTDEDTDYHPTDPTKIQNTEYRHIWQMWSSR